jgi:hypothetical protein
MNAPPADSDLSHIDRDLRIKCLRLLSQMDLLNWPMRVTEAMRTAERQAWLYAQGRDAQGNVIDPEMVVTNAKPGGSKHETGRAADFAFIGARPYADDNPWRVFHALAEFSGLETCNGPHVPKWDKCHVQLQEE